MKRRQLLKTGAGVGTLGLAGCLGVFGGGAGGTESFDTMLSWVPEPSAFDSTLDSYSSLGGDTPAGLASQIDDPVFRGGAQPSLEFANPNATDVDYALETSASGSGGYSVEVGVYVGEFNPDWVEQNLQNTQNDNFDTSYQSEGEYEGFTVYAGEGSGGGFGSQTSYAFSSSGYVTATVSDSGDPNAVAAIETVIDASEGTVSRYQESNQTMSLLAGTLPSAHQFSRVSVNEEPPEQSNPQNGQLAGRVGGARAVTLSGTDLDTTDVLVFASESDVVEQEINEYVDESGTFSGFYGRPSVSVSGRTVSIDGTQPLGAGLPV